MMVSLGEMIAHLPVSGGHITLASRFVDPAFGAAMGWNYWYNWILVLPAELVRAVLSMSLPHALTITFIFIENHSPNWTECGCSPDRILERRSQVSRTSDCIWDRKNIIVAQ